MKLGAKVVRATGATTHGTDKIATRVEIESSDSGFFLFRYDSAGLCFADTWHLTLQEAKEQAAWEYLLGEADWAEINDQQLG